MRIPINKTGWAIVALLAVYGFILRIYSLGQQSLWIDEAFTINAAETILKKGIPLLDSGFWYMSGILNSYITAFSLATLRSASIEFAARLPSVIFGVLTIFLVYAFGKKIANKEVGLISAFLVTFSVWEIAWGRQARMYQQFQFFYVLSLYFFYKFVKTKEAKNAVFAAISTFLALVSHSLAVALIGIFITYAIIMLFKKENIFLDVCNMLKKKGGKESIKKRFLFAGATGIAIAILGILGYYALVNYHFIKIDYLNNYVYYLKDIHFAFFYLAGAGLIISLKEMRKGTLLGLAVIVPIVIISKFIYLLHYRYIYVFLPIFFILAAVFLDWIARQVSTKKVVYFGMVITTIILLVGTSSNFVFLPTSQYQLEKETPQQNFKELYEFLSRNVQEGDIVVDAYPVVNKIYFGKADYALKFSLSGREVGIVNKTNDVYTEVPYISINEIEDIKNCWVIVDDFVFFRVNSTLKEHIITLKQVDYTRVVDKNILRVYHC